VAAVLATRALRSVAVGGNIGTSIDSSTAATLDEMAMLNRVKEGIP